MFLADSPRCFDRPSNSSECVHLPSSCDLHRPMSVRINSWVYLRDWLLARRYAKTRSAFQRALHLQRPTSATGRAGTCSAVRQVEFSRLAACRASCTLVGGEVTESGKRRLARHELRCDWLARG